MATSSSGLARAGGAAGNLIAAFFDGCTGPPPPKAASAAHIAARRFRGPPPPERFQVRARVASVAATSSSASASDGCGAAGRGRLRVEAALGEVVKETASTVGAEARPGDGREIVWSFADELCFELTSKDVAEGRALLTLRLRPGHKDGLRALASALATQLSGATEPAAPAGDALVDLGRQALPACLGRPRCADGWSTVWESEAQPVSFGRRDASGSGGQAAATVASALVVFQVNTDPAAVLAACPEPPELPPCGPFAGVDVDGLRCWAQPAAAAAACSAMRMGCLLGCTQGSGHKRLPGARGKLAEWEGAEPDLCLDGEPVSYFEASPQLDQFTPVPFYDTGAAFAAAAPPPPPPGRAALGSAGGPLQAPDLAPDGWLCRVGPGGRKFWHHVALGPAPWERPLSDISGARPAPEEHAALIRSLMGRVASLREARPPRAQRGASSRPSRDRDRDRGRGAEEEEEEGWGGAR